MEDEVMNTQSNEVETHESVSEGFEQELSEKDSAKSLYDNVRFGKKIEESAPKSKSNEQSGEPVESADGKDQKKKADVPHNKTRERIGELTRKYHTSKSELEKLRQEFEEYRKNSKPLTRAETANDEEYIAKLTEKQVNEQLKTERMKQIEAEAQNAKVEMWNENIKSQVDNYDEFASKYTKYAPILSNHDKLTEEYVLKSPVGPKMLNELFNKLEDPNFANVWFTMPTAKKNIILYELEKYAMTPVAKPQQIQQKSSAPKAIVPGAGKINQSDKTSAQALYDKIRFGR